MLAVNSQVIWVSLGVIGGSGFALLVRPLRRWFIHWLASDIFPVLLLAASVFLYIDLWLKAGSGYILFLEIMILGLALVETWRLLWIVLGTLARKFRFIGDFICRF